MRSPVTSDEASRDTPPVNQARQECDRNGHWPEAARQWAHLAPPLRPSPQDVGFCDEAVRHWVARQGSPRALILGVTPELYHLPWPDATDLLAVDRTPSMIDVVWPGPRDRVLCADWIDMDLPEGSRDIVLCDGGLHLLAYPGEQAALIRVLRRVVSPGGICVFRLYVLPPRLESPDGVLQDLLLGAIPNVSVLKLRLWMAMQSDPTVGIRLKDVWDAVHAAAPDPERVAPRVGWTVEHWRSLDTYRDRATRYHFTDLDGVQALFCREPGGFELASLHVPTSSPGDWCPTAVFRRNAGAG